MKLKSSYVNTSIHVTCLVPHRNISMPLIRLTKVLTKSTIYRKTQEISTRPPTDRTSNVLYSIQINKFIAKVFCKRFATDSGWYTNIPVQNASKFRLFSLFDLKSSVIIVVNTHFRNTTFSSKMKLHFDYDSLEMCIKL